MSSESQEKPTLPFDPDITVRRDRSQPGHWYSFPGQQPLSPPRIEAAPDQHEQRRRSARDRVRRRKIRRETGAPDDWAWVVIAAALLGVTAVMVMAVFFGGRFLRSFESANNTSATSVPPVEPTSVIYGPGGILGEGDEPAVGMLEGESMVIRRWSGKEPFTVLLMGMDKRPSEFGNSYRTDTMILVRIEPTSKQVSMLSIPRDLYVDVPGYGLKKINTAYYWGEYDEPGGGPLLAMRTVQYNLGIRVNEYIVVDFNTFIRVVDLIGGIDINVPYTINDPLYPDMNYGYDPFYIEAGWHHLDGNTALKYARSRHSSDDIDRARRQQQVIFAIRERVLAYDMIPELVMQAPKLWSELNAGIDTGLELQQIIELAYYLQDIPLDNIKSGVLGWEYVYARNYQGQEILVPNRDKISQLMTDIFGPGYNQ